MEDEAKAPRKKGRSGSAAQTDLLEAIRALSSRLDSIEAQFAAPHSGLATATIETPPSYEDPLASFAADFDRVLAHPEVQEEVCDDDDDGDIDHVKDPEDEAYESAFDSEIPGRFPELIEQVEGFNTNQEEIFAGILGASETLPVFAVDETEGANADVHEMMESWVSEAQASLNDSDTTSAISGQASDDDGASMSDDEISALFARADALNVQEPIKEEPEASEMLTADQIAALLSEAPPPEIPVEIAAKVDPESDDGRMMSDEEIAALMAESAAAESHSSDPNSTEVGSESSPEAVPQPTYEIDYSLASKVPMELAVAALALPIEIGPGKLVCLVPEPCDYEALGRLSKSVGLLIDTRDATLDEVLAGLRTLYQEESTRRKIRASVLVGRGVVEAIFEKAVCFRRAS